MMDGRRMEVEQHETRRGCRGWGKKGREPTEFSVRDTQRLRSGWAHPERRPVGSRERCMTFLTPFTPDDLSLFWSDDSLHLYELPFAGQPYRL